MIGAATIYACTPSLQEYPSWTGGAGGGGTTTAGTGGDALVLDAGGGDPPSPDAGGLCGNEFHKIVTNPPNVYFVLDRSGSMAAPAPGGTRYSVVQKAASDIVKHLELLIKAGATVFPAQSSDPFAQCNAGEEVFPVTYGDAFGFKTATQNVKVNGGTPTASTMSALLPKLKALPGTTVVVLATDGAPNCNEFATCDKSLCMENIEGCWPQDDCCALGQNCCAPTGPAGPINCVDRDPTVSAIAALKAAGIRVYVIGIPGSETYEKVLADMALAGGAAIAAWPFYYKVDDLSTIATVLAGAAGSAIPCDFKLGDVPKDPSLTNVYLDKKVVLQDPVDGWTWSAPDTVTLHGAACVKLHTGLVAQVQIVSGCPTEAAK